MMRWLAGLLAVVTLGSPHDTAFVNACTSLEIQLSGVNLGLEPDAASVASIIESLEETSVKKAGKQARRIEKAANDAAMIRALRKAAKWCVKRGWEPIGF